ncbi:MAG: GNAT family N-acetyltransferase, partial [Acidimicrobiales bacterium]
MSKLTIKEEPIDSNGALSVLHAATDELTQRYGGSGDSEHLHVDELRPPLGLFLVARLDGHLAGGVGLRSIADPNSHWGEIKRLWVRVDLRRAGIAAKLMDDVVAAAKRFGYERLYLETGPRQPEAI